MGVAPPLFALTCHSYWQLSKLTQCCCVAGLPAASQPPPTTPIQVAMANRAINAALNLVDAAAPIPGAQSAAETRQRACLASRASRAAESRAGDAPAHVDM